MQGLRPGGARLQPRQGEVHSTAGAFEQVDGNGIAPAFIFSFFLGRPEFAQDPSERGLVMGDDGAGRSGGFFAHHAQ